MLLTFLAQNQQIAPNAGRLSDSAPAKSQIGPVDAILNLLVTTLAVVVVALPPGQQAHASAPAIRAPVTVDAYPNLSILGTNAQPAGDQYFESASSVYARYVPQSDVYQNLVLRGTNAQPAGDQSSDSAISAYARYTPQVDVYPNLIVRGTNQLPVGARADYAQYQTQRIGTPDPVYNPLLAAVVAAPLPIGKQLIDSAPRGIVPTALDIYPNLAIQLVPAVARIPQVMQWQSAGRIGAPDPVYNLAVTVAALPPGRQLSDSAPRPGSVAYSLIFPARQQAAAVAALPAGAQLFASAPYPPIAAYPDLDLQLITANPLPAGRQVSDNLWQLKYQVRVDQYPNVALNQPNAQLLGAQLSDDPLQPKYAVQADQYLNPIVLIPVVVTPLPPGLQISDSAPALKYSILLDVAPDLVVASMVVPVLVRDPLPIPRGHPHRLNIGGPIKKVPALFPWPFVELEEVLQIPEAQEILLERPADIEFIDELSRLGVEGLAGERADTQAALHAAELAEDLRAAIERQRISLENQRVSIEQQKAALEAALERQRLIKERDDKEIGTIQELIAAKDQELEGLLDELSPLLADLIKKTLH